MGDRNTPLWSHLCRRWLHLRPPPIQNHPLKPQPSPGAVATSGAEVVAEIEAAADLPEADKIIIVNKIKLQLKTLLKLILPTIKNLIKRVPDTLTGPQIAPAPAIGPKAVERPTAQILWSVDGPRLLHQDRKITLLQIEKSACLA